MAEVTPQLGRAEVVTSAGAFVISFASVAATQAGDINKARDHREKIHNLRGQVDSVQHGFLEHGSKPSAEMVQHDAEVIHQYRTSIQELRHDTPQINVAATVGEAFGAGLATMALMGVAVNRLRHFRHKHRQPPSPLA